MEWAQHAHTRVQYSTQKRQKYTHVDHIHNMHIGLKQVWCNIYISEIGHTFDGSKLYTRDQLCISYRSDHAIFDEDEH